MAQSVERRIGSAEVTGSIPVSSFYESHQFVKLLAFFLSFFISYWYNNFV